MILRRTVQIVSWIALAGTILPSLAFLTGSIKLDAVKGAMLAATIVWFIATPLWMGQEYSKARQERPAPEQSS